MGGNLFELFAFLFLLTGVRTGYYALRAVEGRKWPSQTRGVISVALVVIGLLMLMVAQGSPPDLMMGLVFGTGAIPGTLAVIRNRPPTRRKHGHCRTCSYNLRGNVSGKCSECGAQVPAP